MPGRDADIAYAWRGAFEDREVEALHAEGFGHAPTAEKMGTRDRGAPGWRAQVERHSLGWVCARDGDALVGFVNLAWDGRSHAFILDTLVAQRARRRGIGTRLVGIAMEEARAAGCEWLHVDFEEELADFYLDACGFEPTPAGLIAL